MTSHWSIWHSLTVRPVNLCIATPITIYSSGTDECDRFVGMTITSRCKLFRVASEQGAVAIATILVLSLSFCHAKVERDETAAAVTTMATHYRQCVRLMGDGCLNIQCTRKRNA